MPTSWERMRMALMASLDASSEVLPSVTSPSRDAILAKRLRLEGCDLTRAELFGTKLAGVDLSSCEIAALRVSDTFRELRGAKVGIDQAPDLIGLLGVKLS